MPPEESADRFREAVEIVLKAWTEERFTYKGQHFAFDGIELLPKPLQRPHPPVWMAATSEPAIDWAASRGFSILMDPHSSTNSSVPSAGATARSLPKSGFEDSGRDIPMARLLALASTKADAEAIARRGAQWLVDSYAGSAACRVRRPCTRSGPMMARSPCSTTSTA